MLPTGGGLVFAGDIARYFRAFDESTGKVLWEMRLNNAVNALAGVPLREQLANREYRRLMADCVREGMAAMRAGPVNISDSDSVGSESPAPNVRLPLELTFTADCATP